MDLARDLNSLRSWVRDAQKQGQRIAFVPTMGNLHEGHMTLLDSALEDDAKVVVSIFVNPIQFGRGEDYERYPSTLDVDRTRLAARGASLLFTPNLDELYPGGTEADTRVTVPHISDILCGEFRPGHFSGVATVVAKLLINVQPDVAYFGEKDYQQLLVIRRLVRDLCIPVEIVGCPIVREADGLAMSSRNVYLSDAERSHAATIFRVMDSVATTVRADGDIPAALAEGNHQLIDAGFRPEYLTVRRASDLALPATDDRELRVLAAAWLGNARLIDNLAVERPT